MAITAETRQDIMELAVAANGAAPGTTLLSELVAMSTSGSSLLDIANHLADSASFKATYPTFQTASEFGTEFLNNLVPEASAAAKAEGVAIIEGMIAAGSSRGAIILEAATFLAALDESDASFGSSAALFNNRVEVATYHTITSEAADSWAIPASVTSSDDTVATAKAAVDAALDTTPAPVTMKLDLTSGADTLAGGSSDDSFNAGLNGSGQQTLNSLDSLNGGAGTDTLNASLSGSASPLSLSAIENINITATGAATLDLRNADSVSSLSALGSTAALTVNNVPVGTTLAISDTTQNTTIGSKGASGSSDSASLTLAAVTGAADVSLASIESISIATAADSSIDLVASSAKTLTLTGDAGLTIGNMNTSGSRKVSTIDGSAATGKITVTTGNLSSLASSQDVTITTGSAGDDVDISGHTASDYNVSTGAGNDRVTAAPGADDTIAAGDGTDTLELTASLASANANITGFEKLEYTAAAAVSVDQDNLSGSTITQLYTKVAGANNITLSDVTADFTTLALNYTGVAAANTGTTSVDRKTDTSADSMNVVAQGVDHTTLTLNDEETLNFSSNVAATTITTLNAADAVTINVSGTEDLTIGTVAGNTNLATIDASASTGAVSVAGTANGSLVAMTITAGSGGLTADGAGADDTMTGGAGADSFDGGAGNDTLTGGDGADDLDGEAGNDVITGGGGKDTLTSGAGVDHLDGGDGDDTIVLSTNYSTAVGTADTIEGGAGTDTVTITTANATLTPTWTGVEKVTMTAGAGGANTLVFSSATGLYYATVADGADVGTVLSSMPSAAYVVNADTGNTLTVDTVASGNLNVYAAAVNTNALTITDASTVTLNGSANGGAFNNTVLDNIDTTSLTVKTSGGTNDIDSGAITGSDKVASLTMSTTAAGGTATVGTIADADSLETITLTGTGGNITVGAVGGTGSAEVLSSITATATAASDILIGNITADTSNSVTDNAMTVTASANDAGSSVVFGVLNNQFGSVTGTLSGTQNVDFTTGAATITADSADFTRSGTGDTTFDAFDITTTLTVTHNGSGTMTITTADAEGDTVITSTLGVLTATSTSTDNLTMTGAGGADTLVGSGTTETGKSHTLDGGAGNDTITGGGGADTLLGGDGNDQITAGAGNDSINAGAGTDTIVMAANLTSQDTVDGGDGTDTLTASPAANFSGTLSNVERLTLDFTAADSGTFSLANATSVDRLTVTADTDNDAVAIAAIPTGATVILNDDDLILTADTVAGASLIVDVRSSAAGSPEALTITDAASVTLKSGASANSATASVALDAVDTTSLTVTGAAAAVTLATGNITGTNKLGTVDISTSTTSGTATVGTIADADSLTSLTLTATNANATVGQIGTDATANNAELLATVTVNATGAATATTNGIYADSTVNSTTDLAMTVTVTTESAATSTMGLIDNTYGTITGTYATEGTMTQAALTYVSGTITASGAGSNTFAAVNGSGAIVFNTSGAGTFEITDANVDGTSASLTVDGSAQTGTVDVTATNSSAAVTLTGGSGADTLIGGSGNDSLVGGAGNDAITLNGGFDTVEAGAGTDTITVGGNISLTDNIDGGDGTDTITATIDTATVHQFGTMTNVEVVTLAFDAAGTYKANDNSASTYNLTVSDGAATAADMDNIGSGKTVDLEHDDLNGVALDYTANATATIRIISGSASDNPGNLTVTDAQTVTIQSGTNDKALGAVTLDATDTDFVTVSTATTGADLTQTGAFASDNAVTFTVTASKDNSAISLGAGSTVLATADLLTTITLTADSEDDADITLTDIGTTVAAAALETLTITASADSTIASASGADITMAKLDAAGATMTSATIAANYTGSVITIGGDGSDDEWLATSLGTLTVSAVSGATVDVRGGVDIGTIGQLTASGAGTIIFDDDDNDVSTLERVDSTVSGTFTVDFHQTTDIVTYTLGSGTNTITTGTANDVVYLKASGGTDDIKLSTSSTGSITIHNFQVGASADDIVLSLTGLKAGTTATDYVNLDDAASAANTNAVASTTITGVIDFDSVTANDNLLVINADVASNAALETALEASGAHEITLNGTFADGDAILVLYDNGTDSFLVSVEMNDADAGGGAGFAADDTFATGDLTAVTLITFVGISDATTIVDGNFGALVT